MNGLRFPRACRRAVALLALGFACTAGSASAGPLEAVGGYVWHRTTDLLDVLRCGIAVGPCLGAEAAIGDRLQLGAYASAEGGLTFPHFLPPLWPLTHLDGSPVFQVHEGRYGTAVFGTRRRQSSLRRSQRFPRSPYEARLQVAAGLLHGYVSVNGLELLDFAVGWFGKDPLRDDELP